MHMQTHYTVRFNDCDPYGHLNNSSYIDYLLNAREDHLSQFHNIELNQFRKQGFGWVVSSHEIQYIRPAAYNERVSISSDLIEAADSHLLVEMRMYDATGENLKAILWTKFTCINMKTSRKEFHPADFMVIANQMLTHGIPVQDGLKARVNELLRKNKVAADIRS